jgi:hypothetical protein
MLEETVKSIELRIEAIVERYKQVENSIHKHFDDVIQQVEARRKMLIDQLTQDREYRERALKSQLSQHVESKKRIEACYTQKKSNLNAE